MRPGIYYDVASLAVLIAHSIYQAKYVAAVAFSICLAICIFISSYPLDPGSRHLPTRENFLRQAIRLPRDDDTGRSECPVCYDELGTPAKLPCGHVYCHDCVTQLFGPEYRDHHCPICRIPLFQVRAPWNMLSVKAFVCKTVLDLIRILADLAILALRHESAGPGRDSIHISLGQLVLGTGSLVYMSKRLSYSGLTFWKQWSSWWYLLMPMCFFCAVDVWKTAMMIQKDMELLSTPL